MRSMRCYRGISGHPRPNQTKPLKQRGGGLTLTFNALRYVVRYGIAWRAMPNDLPPWAAVYQQSQRWLAAGCFETLAQDLRALLGLASGRAEEPTAAIIDSRYPTLHARERHPRRLRWCQAQAWTES